jgi:uncharacterized protein
MPLTENQIQIIENTRQFVEKTLLHAEAGHDYWHIYRVWRNTGRIAETENVDHFVVELAALLHDIADAKFYDGDETVGPEIASRFLATQNVDPATIMHIVRIIENISFKNSFEENKFTSPELAVVQDADRLDATGAIGIARAFNYGGFKNRPFYDPAIQPDLHLTKESYKNSVAPTINHFYEKLLLLKDKMNTPTGRSLAEKLHQFMLAYLDQFFKEWEGKI